MDSLKIFETDQNSSWEYDEEADVFLISFGEPQKALGLDAGVDLLRPHSEDMGGTVGFVVITVKDRSPTQWSWPTRALQMQLPAEM